MGRPWTRPTRTIVLVAIATAAEVFVVLALLWTTDSNFRRVAGRAFGAVTMSKWEIDTNRFGGD